MSPSAPQYAFGPFQVDVAERLLVRGSQPVALTAKAFELLSVLLQESGHLVAKQELLRRVWGDSFVEEAVLSVNIAAIRRALTDNGHRYIETVPRHGYRFIAPVQEITAADISPLHDGRNGSPAATPLPDPMMGNTAVANTGRKSRLWWILVTAAVVVAAVPVRIPGRFPAPPAVDAQRVMLVVLPFVNLGRDPQQDYFSAGLTEEITTKIAELPSEGLGVIAHTSARQYKNSGKRIKEIGRELGVDYVVEGGVLRAGDRVRVSVKLIRARDQSSVWAQEYQGRPRDVLVLQAKIAEDIAREVGLKLTMRQQTEVTSARLIDPDTHEAYLRAIYELRKLTPDSLEIAIQYFQQALARDPNNAQAYAGLADAYYSQSTRYKAPLAVMPLAKAAALRAVQLDPASADAHASLGNIKLHFDWDWPGAEQEFRRALQLNPSHAWAHAGYAAYFQTLGRGQEATRELGRARELDPLLPIHHGGLAWYLFEQRRYHEAIEVAQHSPSGNAATVALSYAELGRTGEAIASADHAVESESDPIALSQMAAAYAISGRKDKAQKLLRTVEQQSAQRYVCGVNAGGAYAAFGDKEHAFIWLERAYHDRSD
jgi:TolB-like protein/DNA-binding winged helix-turn-helix (wHTH) protein/Flp pilus assembly protein TadD